MLQAVACGFKWLFTGLALSRLISVISFTKKLLKPLFNDLFNIVVGDAGGAFHAYKESSGFFTASFFGVGNL